MASTYSTSLKLTLIGDGDQTGTWGQTTNTNLGTLLEQAIVGQTTVIMVNADYTLTNLNGATDEARSAVLILTGNQNATYSVIVPAVPKLYMVTNSLNSSAIAYIKPSGGSTIQVPNGRTMYLYCTGTAFVALDYVQYAQSLVTGGTITTGAINCTSLTSSGTVSGTTITASTQFSGPGTGLTGSASALSIGGTALNVTGIVAVVNGGSGVTTSTGTGNNVLSTSPTLVTPILGTPTSGVMTNVTGLPLTTGVTGTLPVANGGTGVTSSTGSGNNVLSTSPTLVTPILGTPTSGTLTNCTGYPAGQITGTVNLATQVTGTLPVANGGTGVTSSTGSGNVVLSTSPTLVTPALGTPTSGVLTNATGLPLTTGVTGTLPVANGGTGVTSSTGSGNVVLSTSPTLVTPALGTPSSGDLTNCTFPTLNQNTTGNAATATTATNLSGGTVSATTIGGTTITASTQFSGPGTGLTGTAASLSIGGNAATATTATNLSGGTVSATTISGTTITASTQFSGPGTGLTGTAASLTVGAASTAAVSTTQAPGTNNTTIATTAFVAAAMAVLYPVGSIYTSTVSTNPNTLFGFGTWVAFADARVMIGAGVAYPAGSTGGSANAVLVSHNHGGLTGIDSPDHLHGYSGTTSVENQGHVHINGSGGIGVVGPISGASGGLEEGAGTPNYILEDMGIPNTTHTHTYSGSTGGVNVNHQHGITTEGSSATNANMQPFISVYIWNRTA